MDPLDDRMAILTRALANRALLTPALCFLASHRPLAFVTSQLLYLLEPLANLAGKAEFGAWARLLGDPQGLKQLERAWAGEQTVTTESLEHHDCRQ